MPNFTVYFPEAELDLIKIKATELKMSVSEYIRHLTKQIPEPRSKQAEIDSKYIKFMAQGLEYHWKNKTQDVYEAALLENT
jgi:hypothetical protein